MLATQLLGALMLLSVGTIAAVTPTDTLCGQLSAAVDAVEEREPQLAHLTDVEKRQVLRHRKWMAERSLPCQCREHVPLKEDLYVRIQAYNKERTCAVLSDDTYTPVAANNCTNIDSGAGGSIWVEIKNTADNTDSNGWSDASVMTWRVYEERDCKLEDSLVNGTYDREEDTGATMCVPSGQYEFGCDHEGRSCKYNECKAQGTCAYEAVWGTSRSIAVTPYYIYCPSKSHQDAACRKGPKAEGRIDVHRDQGRRRNRAKQCAGIFEKPFHKAELQFAPGQYFPGPASTTGDACELINSDSPSPFDSCTDGDWTCYNEFLAELRPSAGKEAITKFIVCAQEKAEEHCTDGGLQKTGDDLEACLQELTAPCNEFIFELQTLCSPQGPCDQESRDLNECGQEAFLGCMVENGKVDEACLNQACADEVSAVIGCNEMNANEGNVRRDDHRRSFNETISTWRVLLTGNHRIVSWFWPHYST